MDQQTLVERTKPPARGRPVAEADAEKRSVRRMLRLLLCFSGSQPCATAEELATLAGLPLSSTYRYLSMMREAGLVEDHGRKGFTVGTASVRLAQAAQAAFPMERIARPFVHQLGIDSGESVVLLRRMNEKAICVDGWEATEVIRSPVKIGSSVPLHFGAGPRVLLASLASPTREQMLQLCATRHQLDAPLLAELKEDLNRIAQRGWAICDGAAFRDVYAVAAPIRDDRHESASIAVVAPSFRVSPETAGRLRDQVLEFAAAISAALRTQQPHSLSSEAAL